VLPAVLEGLAEPVQSLEAPELPQTE